MFLSDYWLQWKAWFKKDPEPSIYQEAIARYRNSSPYTTEVYRDFRLLLSHHASIETYTRELERINYAFTHEKNYRLSGKQMPVEVTFGDFFLTKSGCYGNPEHLYEEYRRCAIDFLTLYEEASNQLDQSVIISNLLYYHSSTANNVIELSHYL